MAPCSCTKQIKQPLKDLKGSVLSHPIHPESHAISCDLMRSHACQVSISSDSASASSLTSHRPKKLVISRKEPPMHGKRNSTQGHTALRTCEKLDMQSTLWLWIFRWERLKKRKKPRTTRLRAQHVVNHTFPGHWLGIKHDQIIPNIKLGSIWFHTTAPLDFFLMQFNPQIGHPILLTFEVEDHVLPVMLTETVRDEFDNKLDAAGISFYSLHSSSIFKQLRWMIGHDWSCRCYRQLVLQLHLGRGGNLCMNLFKFSNP